MSQAGIYATTNPNIRIRAVQDDDFYDDPNYAPEVREILLEAHEAGEVYGVIVEQRVKHETKTENLVTGEITQFADEDWWAESDSIWSCAGYENVAKEVAKYYFNIDVTERTS